MNLPDFEVTTDKNQVIVTCTCCNRKNGTYKKQKDGQTQARPSDEESDKKETSQEMQSFEEGERHVNESTVGDVLQSVRETDESA